MSQEEYIKILQRELKRINKIIDFKILNGEEYSKEMKEHKILLMKMRQHNHSKKNIFNRLFTASFQF